MLNVNEVTRLYLGVQGENLQQTITIDVSPWLVAHPGGSVSIWHKRNGDLVPAPTGAVFDDEAGTVTWTPTSTDTYVDGEGEAEIRLTVGTVIKKSRSIITGVSPAVTGAGVPLGSDWQSYIDEVERIKGLAVTAKQDAEDAAEDAEAYAAGTRAGEDVESTDPAYHNNAKYYAEETAGEVENAEAYAIGTRNGEPVSSGDPAYENNSKYYAEHAAETIEEAAGQIIEAAKEEVDEWLSEHPEATTTVEDGAITKQKLAQSLKDEIVFVPELLELSDSDEAGNTTLLNDKLSEGDVILKPGSYPIEPGVIIDSCTLDLNGSTLYTVDYAASRKMFTLSGYSPCIKNGELIGVISGTNKQEEMIAINSSSDVVIENIYIHDVSGRGISGNLNSQYGERTAVATASEFSTTDYVHRSGNINVKSGYKYVRTVGSYGFNAIYTVEDVQYQFYDENDTLLKTEYLPPSVNCEIPENATYFVVGTETGRAGQADGFIPYQVGFTNHNNKCKILHCIIKNTKDWSIANLFGDSLIEDVKLDAGIDIEDHQGTDVKIVDSEILGNSFIRSYYASYTNTYFYGIRPQYGKVHHFYNCKGGIVPSVDNLYMQPAICIIGGDITPFYMSGVTDEQIHLSSLLITSGPVIRSLYNHVSGVGGRSGFLWRYSGIRGYNAIFKGVENGTFIKRCDKIPQGATFATKPGSSMTIYMDIETLDVIVDHYVAGDCYGINYINGILLPNTFTIYDSFFKPTGIKIGSNNAQRFTGKYVNCEFDAKDYYLFASMSDKNLQFINCRFKNIDIHQIVQYSQYASSVLLSFDNCYFDGHSITSLTDAETYIISDTTNATITINGVVLSATPISNNYIPAPASASSGDFLCYDGSAWDATAVPSGNGVSF